MSNRFGNVFHRWFGAPFRLSIRIDAGTGRPLILLHGIATNAESWQTFVTPAAENFRCIAIDLLGFGSSPKPEWSDYALQTHIKSIHKTIKKLKLHQKFILIGHSMGSIIAANYAATYPDEVSELFMLSPPIVTNLSKTSEPADVTSKYSYANVYRYIRRHKRFTIGGMVYVKKLLRTSPFDLDEHNWVPFVRSLRECIEMQHVDQDLAKVPGPVTIYYGSKDRVISRANVRSLNTLPNVSVRSAPAWHAINRAYTSSVLKNLLSESGST